ncbi:TPA: hypothetical protein NHO72_004920 [Pseudomonas aeruginosa]|nr:hypothetical protein [Pseudomonas aeruginosa]
MSNEDWNELDESYRSALSGALETAHPAVEQAGGDERAACNLWIAEQQLCQGSDISLFKLERNGALVSLHDLLRDAYQAGQARAALAQPSPAQAEQAEAERPEVVARVVHSNPVVLGQCGPLNANDELMTVAQHAASVARWAEMFNRVEQQRDDALARVAELERQEPVDVPGPDEIHQMAFEEGQPAEDGDGYLFSAEEFDLFVQRLLDSCATPVARAQHSVPDGAADLCRFLAKLYCELDGLRYSTAKLPAEQIADALIFKWPVLQGARNQLNIKRISEQPYDESKLHSAIAAMLAASPGKEGV